MKRYVKEFANDIIESKHVEIEKRNYEHPRKKSILNIVSSCERGYITNYEAIHLIIKINEESKENHESWEAK